MHDEEICRQIRGGDPRAEEEFVLRFQPGLRAIARVRVGSDQADDVVQDTLAAALANLRRGDWRGDGPLAAYLAAILRRLCLRSRPVALRFSPEREAADVPDLRPDPSAVAETVEVRSRVREALSRIPIGQREVLLRHYIEGEGVREIARILNIPRGTVLSRLHHARLKMSKIMNRP
ncbi:MAG: RNA polymerase sigma factor [Candidatus Polarisedimenticolia bacterium]